MPQFSHEILKHTSSSELEHVTNNGEHSETFSSGRRKDRGDIDAEFDANGSKESMGESAEGTDFPLFEEGVQEQAKVRFRLALQSFASLSSGLVQPKTTPKE
uniref:Uncharacterized protein n=1 Tax=Setaria digitata TaxID=48799 RepID=A0A915PJR0_9BILA